MGGGGDGFEDFYRAGYPRLVASLFLLTGELTAAQDLAQEAFVRAWDRWQSIRSYEQPMAWVQLVGQRLAISHRRRVASGLRRLVRHGPPAPSLAGPDPTAVAVVAALRRLPVSQQRALVLHYLADLPVARVAAELGVSEGTVKTWLARGRRAAAGLLADESSGQSGKGWG